MSGASGSCVDVKGDLRGSAEAFRNSVEYRGLTKLWGLEARRLWVGF